ncbi:hypothetical protein ACH42_16820 [Endozoicomonas sp. (ex Bugula neritina AB1)]|nr:hypothetical protein ACH42_16820 [Endozoicomonas sp. (ex Bugula neritina AB1)]
MKTEELPPIRFPLVNRFLKDNGHKGKVRGNERAFILRNDQGKIVAALRACSKTEGYLLRSVQVDRTLYGKGYGSRLVKEAALMLMPAQCWCYPFRHLQHFYEECEFQQCSPQEVPEDIRGPYERYVQQDQGLLLMVFRLS